MSNKPFFPLFLLFLSACSLFAFTQPDAVNRGAGWRLEDFNTSRSANPSNLKYFTFYDNLPDEVTLKIFDKMNLSGLANKRLFVGYGVVDPTGKDCRVFTPQETGGDRNVTVCLPWWRIERVYELNASSVNDKANLLREIPEPHPPVLVNVCKKWTSGPDYPGGKVTCTKYYSKRRAPGCYDNPRQPKCLVTNCAKEIINHCRLVEGVVGEKRTLIDAEYVAGEPEGVEGMVDLATLQFICPPGPIAPKAKCEEEVSALMYPYQCEAPSNERPDGRYVYCDKGRPVYETDGSLKGFLGNCPGGRTVMCEVNTIRETRRKCVEPVTEHRSEEILQEYTVDREYEIKRVDVLSGEPDRYASDPNCVRANTVEESRDLKVTIHIVGDGSLDDDIWVFRHKANGSKTKIYCNQQHNENRGSRKEYDGVVYQCIDNNGAYSFDRVLAIDGNDIVSVQQASEEENNRPDAEITGRHHYRSTRVVIDNVLVAPDTFPANFPAYPNNDGNYLKTWDNALSTLSLLFPYAGAYDLTFWDRYGRKVAEASLGIDDFRRIAATGNLQLKLARSMSTRTNPSDSRLCLEDDWVEWGGGVYGGHSSKNAGVPCYGPDDGWSRGNAISLVMIKDLFTGTTTRVPLVYPLPYPNRVFISKLRVYEHRVYHCYRPFQMPSGM